MLCMMGAIMARETDPEEKLNQDQNSTLRKRRKSGLGENRLICLNPLLMELPLVVFRMLKIQGLT